MTPNPITIEPDVSIAEAHDWMRQQKVRRFPVVDKGTMVEILDVREI